ncbi:2-phosphosulfolactate phosphatase [Nocardia bovistercoris]|uniref:Probable 2-phosphosulfolactate phosphatase n=1 Tax=Nocardia bovistercoris TaxID=2785916 RepID=A0A931N6C2_9NOCA|nr:2-phosphosulfolactate phosphatase [Nocardia bovistercoris]
MNSAHRQIGHTVRFDWGRVGAAAVGADARVTVVVDVLSFTTTLSVAADLGVTVLPYRWRDESAARYAAEHDAVLAVGRREAGAGQVSLSPATVRSASGLTRLVLPSPNGSSIAYTLAAHATCVGASLRNARAVAAWITAEYPATAAVAVVAAGELWPDGSLRPAVEDLWGAGAVISELLRSRGATAASPEAKVAVAAWRAIAEGPREALLDCASGRELVEGGFGGDVLIAAEIDSSRSVPVLDGAHGFRDAAAVEGR